MKKHRKRRSTFGVKELLIPYKNIISGWTFTGDKTTVQALFPDDDPRFYLHKGKEGIKSLYIPDEVFFDQDTITQYGENLQKQRKDRGWTLKEVAEAVGITFQQLRQIELGKRKSINKNYLMLFCGFYHVPPAILLNYKYDFPFKVDMEFFAEPIGKRANYIIARLNYQKRELLEAFCNFSSMPFPVRQKLYEFLSSAPAVSMLTSEKIEKLMDSKEYEIALQVGKQGTDWFGWSEYFVKLCEMGYVTPELLDVYVSIASANESVWDLTLQLLSLAGFYSFPLSVEGTNYV